MVKKHQNDPSVGSTPSIRFTFSIERTIARIREGPFNEGFNSVQLISDKIMGRSTWRSLSIFGVRNRV